MMIEPKPQPAPEPFSHEREILKQTELLQKINGKIAFFVWLAAIALVLQFLGSLL